MCILALSLTQALATSTKRMMAETNRRNAERMRKYALAQCTHSRTEIGSRVRADTAVVVLVVRADCSQRRRR